ncbi:PLP-dependent aminotransferase family protein [Streptomyces sp. NPDC006393]|uniref:aminotransferase-like domain-containing protein n=1 Tax=Streptomyces sp. NPDC006393 TaxID=3156763 RepID=UPI0033D55B63
MPQSPWVPGPLPEGRPTYVGLADVLAGDIARGRLRAGDRLPTHRHLARTLGVTVGTVARAYAEAERRGLVGGEVGRGTFVRSGFGLADAPAATEVDLASLHPPITDDVDPAALLGATLAALACDPRALRSVTDTERGKDLPAHRAAAAAWVARAGFRPPPERVVLTAGAQHALTAALLAVAAPGQVATTPLTNPGLIAAARQLSVPVVAVESDEDGMLPDALADVCAAGRVTLVHLQPTLANPSGRTMPASRRAALAEVCARANVWVLEDDPLGPLAAEGPDPVAALLPDRTCLVTSTAKALALGLRIGVVVAPEAAGPDLVAAVRATTWLTAPLLGEVLTRWVDEGTADRIAGARRAAVRRRNAMATEILAGLGVRPDPAAPHLWLPLPEPWGVGQFTAAARDAGVLVSPGDEYTTSRRQSAFGVRVGLNADVDDDALRRALLSLVGLLHTSPRGPNG